MAADPNVTRFKALARKVKRALDKRKPPPLDALTELAARGDQSARALLAKRSTEDVVLDALIESVHANGSRCSYVKLIAESKHPHVRERVLAELATAKPAAFYELAGALVELTPGKSRREAECAQLLVRAQDGITYVIPFVQMHGTAAQQAELPALFDRELPMTRYLTVLQAVDKLQGLDGAAMFDRYRSYFTRDDRETEAGKNRIAAIRDFVQDRTPIDPRWVEFLLGVVEDGDGHARNAALWLLEDLGKQLGKRFPHAAICKLARPLVGVDDLNLWCHLFDIIALAPDADYVALVVERLAAQIDNNRTLEALEALPKRLVADALHAHGIPKLGGESNRERLDALVAALHVHAPEYATDAPKPELLWQLIEDADADGVQRLLVAGISPETPRPEHRYYAAPTPLFHAIGSLYTAGIPAQRKANLAIVTLLVEAGAKPDVMLGDTWDLHDVRFKKRDTPVSMAHKLLAHVTPPFDNSFDRPVRNYEDVGWMSDDDRAALRPMFNKVAKLLPAAS